MRLEKQGLFQARSPNDRNKLSNFESKKNKRAAQAALSLGVPVIN